jgi:hypothetical protein
MKTKAVLAAAMFAAMVGAAAQAQGRLKLRYHFAAGDMRIYAVKATCYARWAWASGDRMDPVAPTTVLVHGTMAVRTAKVGPDGAARQALQRIAMTCTMPGQESRYSIEAGKARAVVNGETHEWRTPKLDAEVFGCPLASTLDVRGRLRLMDGARLRIEHYDGSLMHQSVPILPPAVVSPGDHWSQEVVLPVEIIGRNLDLAMNYRWTLVGMETYKGRHVARISFDGAGKISGDAGKGSFSTIERKCHGYELFDYQAGQALYHTEKVEQIAAGERRRAPGRPPAAPMNITMTADTEIVLTRPSG